jgi:uncharacterized membrane protein
MEKNPAATVVCQICRQRKKLNEVFPGELLRDSIVETIRKDHPDWSSSDYICLPDLGHFRALYVQDVLEVEKGELSSLEEEVVRSLREQEVLAKNINAEFDRQLTFGGRVADKVAEFGGSWVFIISFFVVLMTWIAINSGLVLRRPFDLYPFILLNLVLSCLAAIQAPVILMSQNRHQAKDRLQAEHDYRINLKAELEIRNLHAKVDQLLTHQWQRLLEIQQIQMEMMEELVHHTPREAER